MSNEVLITAFIITALIKERNDYKHSYIKALKLRNLQVKVLSKSMDMHSLSMSFATQVNEECDVVDEIYDCFREDYDSLKKEVRNYLKEANKFNEEYYEREN